MPEENTDAEQQQVNDEVQTPAEGQTKVETVNWEEKYKQLQFTLQKSQENLKKLEAKQGNNSEIERLATKIDGLEELLAMTVDKISQPVSEFEEVEKPAKQESLYAKFTSKKQQENYDKQWKNWSDNVKTNMESAIEEAGLNLDDERLKDISNAIKGNDYNKVGEAQIKLPLMIAKISKEENKKMTDSMDKIIEAKVNKLLKEKAINSGDFSLDGGAGAAPTDLQALLNKDDRKMNYADKLKYKKELQEAAKKAGVITR